MLGLAPGISGMECFSSCKRFSGLHSAPPENDDASLEPSSHPAVRSASPLRRHEIEARKRLIGSTADKIKGMANEAAGNVKQAVGKAKAAVKKVIDKA